MLIKIYLTFIKLHSCNILRYSSRFFLSWHLCCDFCWKSPRKNLFYRRRSHLGRLPALLHLFGMLPLSFTCLIKHSYLFAYHQPNISTLCISSCDKGQVTNLWTEDKTKFETHPGAAHACRIRRQTCDRSQSQKERVVKEHPPQLRLRSRWVMSEWDLGEWWVMSEAQNGGGWDGILEAGAAAEHRLALAWEGIPTIPISWGLNFWGPSVTI